MVQPAAAQRRALLAVVLITALVYTGVVVVSVRSYGGNLSSLVMAGDHDSRAELRGLGHHVVVYRNSSGYDGLAYYDVADDPFLRHPVEPSAFRYQRIGYPLAVWAVSLGRRAWRPAAMVGVNLLAVLAVAYLSGLVILLVAMDTSVWWALASAINPSLLIGVQRDLAEPLTTALSLGGLLLYLRRHVGWAALVLAAATLTREVAILFTIALVLPELGARRIRNAIWLALSVAPYLAWQALLGRVLGQSGAAMSTGQFGAPLGGIRAVVVSALHAAPGHKIGWASVGALIAFVCATLVVSAFYLLLRRRDVVTASMLVHGLAALFAGPSIWLGFASAARVFGGLYPLSVFAYARYRGWAPATLVGGVILLTLFTALRFVLGTPAAPYYLTP